MNTNLSKAELVAELRNRIESIYRSIDSIMDRSWSNRAFQATEIETLLARADVYCEWLANERGCNGPDAEFEQRHTETCWRLTEWRNGATRMVVK